ncbi:MAG: triphosphoribosyl-dephospho-CoA synthase CitG [Vagococcus sp.]|uniref:triphosphoribosyl-dephospho-CoA synthase CitG n=1 Tax=Vagococcus sp. TaxID=1933889 RepID=UPI002FC776F8
MERNKKISIMAYEALLEEVNLSPKPGLVDRLNNGSHQDMTIETFYSSANAIAPYFTNYIQIGYEHKGTPLELFDKMRFEGAKAEKEMMRATKNINTHKGANFSFAVILGALGKYEQTFLGEVYSMKDIHLVLDYTSKMCEGLASRDFLDLNQKESLSNGEKLYLKTGITGIRGEAESGYASLEKVLLPQLLAYKELTRDERNLRGFIDLMSAVEDSNIYHRGGLEGIQFLKKEALLIKEKDLTYEELITEMTELDQKMIKKNLSPGGSADLLSLGIFLFSLLENKIS